MDLISLKKNTRKKQRAAWKEFNFIIERYRAIGFEYVVSRPLPARISFGTTLDREIQPYAKRDVDTSAETYSAASPKQHKLKTKYKNWAPFASNVARFKAAPMEKLTKAVHLKSRVPQVKFKENCAPFNANAKRVLGTPCPQYPEPGRYNEFKRKYGRHHSFGGRTTNIPATRTQCTPYNISECQVCGNISQGDYWHDINTKKDMCLICFRDEVEKIICKSQTKSKKIEALKRLKAYERVRYCNFIHQHDGTTACIKLLPCVVLTKKLRLENYLGSYRY